jgi:hypothetical protein
MIAFVNRKIGRIGLSLLMIFQMFLISSCFVIAEIEYDLTYQDPAGDVLEFNETWSNRGTVDSQSQIDIKWLISSEGTADNMSLRLEFKNNQIIEESNETKYVFRIFTSQDNSTGYNITYMNGSSFIANFNKTFHEDMSSNTSKINDKGEVLVIKVLKNRYLLNISYYNIDAFTWKGQGNKTYIDYVSEIPGHPADTGSVVDQDNGVSKEDAGLLDSLCQLPLILMLAILIVIIIFIAILWRRRY